MKKAFKRGILGAFNFKQILKEPLTKCTCVAQLQENSENYLNNLLKNSIKITISNLWVFFFFSYIYSLKLSMTMKICRIDRTSIAWNKKEERTREREKRGMEKRLDRVIHEEDNNEN